MADSPASEIDLDKSAVRALLRRDAPHLADLPLTRAAEGWDNAMWRLGADLAVRLPRREAAAPLIAHEQRALPEIAAAVRPSGVLVPAPLLHGAPGDGYPWSWSVVPWLPGGHALGRPRSANGVWAPQLASALLLLHVAGTADAPPNPVRGVPLARRDPATRTRLGRIAATRPALADILLARWEAGLEAAPTRERVWIHGDLHPGNVLVDNGRLTALIDFGDVTAGDPAYDLTGAWLAFDADGRCAFRDATSGRYDDATWMRARAWAAALTAILLDASDDRPDFRALGESTAAELTGTK